MGYGDRVLYGLWDFIGNGVGGQKNSWVITGLCLAPEMRQDRERGWRNHGAPVLKAHASVVCEQISVFGHPSSFAWTL